MTDQLTQQQEALEALREIETALESPATDGGWLNDRCATLRFYIMMQAAENKRLREYIGDISGSQS